MVLGERLSSVANFVKTGSKVADIGTDHAKLPIYLLLNKKISFAIASDKNEGPLTFARENILKYNLENKIEVRLTDGLKSFKPGEIDTAIIAGMGGALITEILSNSSKVLETISMLILQPMNEGNVLRNWLQKNSWLIENEVLTKEDGRIYEIICAKPGIESELSPNELLFGPIILKNKNELLKEKINSIIFKHKQKILGMEKSKTAVQSEKYLYEKSKLKSLEDLLW